MTTDLLDLRADGPLLIFSFETGDDTSKLTRKFIADLSALVMQGSAKKPLVITGTHGVAFVYRAVPNWAYSLRDSYGRELFGDIGRKFADIKSDYSGRLKFSIGDELSAAVHLGAWAGDRTPENTARFQLPCFNDETTSRALAALVDRWNAEGHIVDIKRPVAPQGSYDGFTSSPRDIPLEEFDPSVRRAVKEQREHDARHG